MVNVSVRFEVIGGKDQAARDAHQNYLHLAFQGKVPEIQKAYIYRKSDKDFIKTQFRELRAWLKQRQEFTGNGWWHWNRMSVFTMRVILSDARGAVLMNLNVTVKYVEHNRV